VDIQFNPINSAENCAVPSNQLIYGGGDDEFDLELLKIITNFVSQILSFIVQIFNAIGSNLDFKSVVTVNSNNNGQIADVTKEVRGEINNVFGDLNNTFSGLNNAMGEVKNSVNDFLKNTNEIVSEAGKNDGNKTTTTTTSLGLFNNVLKKTTTTEKSFLSEDGKWEIYDREVISS